VLIERIVGGTTMSIAMEPFALLTDEVLARVAGGSTNPGYDPSNDALGRIGPGRGMGFLGNYYTPEALAHDEAVRGAKASGASTAMAHLSALPKLPAAAASWFRARFAPGPQDMQLGA
jgi:hypothetical protein